MKTATIAAIISLLTVLAHAEPVLTINPHGITNIACEGMPPLSSDIQVWNSGGTESIEYAVSGNAGWFSFSPAYGSCNEEQTYITVSYQTELLSPGSYTGRLTVLGAVPTNGEQDVEILVTITGAPAVIAYNPHSMDVTVTAGETGTVSRQYDVWNSGSAVLVSNMAYIIEGGETWLSIADSGGSSTGQINRHTLVFTNLSALFDGSYTSLVSIQSGTAVNSPQLMEVRLHVEAQPVLQLETNHISVVTTQGLDAVASITIDGSVGGGLRYGAESSKDWLTLSPTGGTVELQYEFITLNLHSRTFPPGTNEASVIVHDMDDPSQSEVVSVELIVEPHDLVIASSNIITHTASIQSGISTQIVEVWNASTGTLEYAMTLTEPWLTIIPEEGTSTGARVQHQFVFDMSSASEGQRTDTVQIYTTGDPANNEPYDIEVTLNVGASFVTAPVALSNSVPEGGAAGDHTLDIWNDGSENPVTYYVSGNASWFSLSESTGASAGETNRITVSYDTTNLPAGVYNGLITITSEFFEANLPVHLQVGTFLGEFEERIVFGATLDGDMDLWAINPDGSDLRKLLSKPGIQHSPILSPDGMKVIFSDTDSTITMLDLQTAEETSLGSRVAPRWLPDSSGWIDASSGNCPGELVNILMDGTETTLIVSPDMLNVIGVAPVSGNVFFTRDPCFGFNTALLAADVSADSKTEIIPADGAARFGGRMSPDGQRFCYTWKENAFHGLGGIAVVNANGSDERLVSWVPTNSYYTPGFNLDGSRLAAVRYAEEASENSLVIIEVDGSGESSILDKPLGNDLLGTSWGWMLVMNPVMAHDAAGFTNTVIAGSTNDVENTFGIWNAGNSYLRYNIASDAVWLSVDPGSGTSTGELDTVTVQSYQHGLAIGTYTGHLKIAANGTNDEQQITVVQKVLGTPSLIVTLPAFQTTSPTGEPSFNMALPIRNGGGQALSYTVEVVGAFMNVDFPTGYNTGGVDNVMITFVPIGLAEGSYTGRIIISNGDDTTEIDTVFNLTQNNPFPPQMTLSTSLVSNQVPKGKTPSSQYFWVKNTGGQRLNYYTSETSDWFRLAPVSASNDQFLIFGGGSNRVEVDYSPINFSPGDYSSAIRVVGSNDTQTVTVAMTVLPPMAYTLAVDRVNGQGGRVEVSPPRPSNLYTQGEHVTVSAVVTNPLYEFRFWLGIRSVEPTVELVMDEDKTAVARFDYRTTVFGWVTNKNTGTPVANAEVHLGGEVATTSASGYYEMYPPPGTAPFWARRTGYVQTPLIFTNIPPRQITRIDTVMNPSPFFNLFAYYHRLSQTVRVKYKLIGIAGERMDVAVDASSDGGKTFPVPVTGANLRGDIGVNVPVRNGYQFFDWNAFADWPGHAGQTNMVIRLRSNGGGALSPPFFLDTVGVPSATFRVYAKRKDASHVEYEVGDELSGAEFYFKGRTTNYLVGLTDAQGLITVPGPLALGDTFFARKRIGTVPPDRDAHGVVDDIKFGLWLDSDNTGWTRNTDWGEAENSDWDGVWQSRWFTADHFTAAQRGEVLDVRLEHPLVEYNLVVQVPRHPTIPDFFDQLEIGLREASKYLYKITYGQCKLAKLYICWDDEDLRAEADVEVHSGNGRATGSLGGIDGSDSDINVYEHNQHVGRTPNGAHWPRTLIHEFGHYAFAFYDEYQNGNGDGSAKFNTVRAKWPDNYPANYGFMQSQHAIDQMSSWNDYLEHYEEREGWGEDDERLITHQIYEYQLDSSDDHHPCWHRLKNARQNSYEAKGYRVDYVSPKRGYLRQGQSTTEDRMSTFTIPRPYSICELKYESGGDWTQVYEKARSPGVMTKSGMFTVVALAEGKPVHNARVVVKPAGGTDLLYESGRTGPDGVLPIATLPAECTIEAYWQGRKASAKKTARTSGDIVLEFASKPGRDEGPAPKATWPLDPGGLGLVVTGRFDAADLTLYYESSLPLTTNISVVAYQTRREVMTTNALTVFMVSTMRFETVIALTNGATGYLDISCLATNGQVLNTLDRFALFPVATNAFEAQATVSPTHHARALNTLGLHYEANGPVILPEIHAYPSNQIGPAVSACLRDDVPLSLSNALNLVIHYSDDDIAGMDEYTLQLCRWDGPAHQWVGVPCDTGLLERSVSAVLTNAGMYVLLADASADTIPPCAISNLVTLPGAQPWEISLNWTAPGDDGCVGTAAVYLLAIGTANITEETWSNSAPYHLLVTPQPAGTAQSAEVLLRDPGVEYFFAMRARDEAGNLSALTNVAVARSTIVDTDGDGLPDQYEETINQGRETPMGKFDDVDGDGLNTWEEFLLRTNPNAADTDGDGMSDGYEDQYGLNPLSAEDREGDSDGDTLTNKEEHDLGTNPNSADTDGDGMTDDWEDEMGLDPTTTARDMGGDADLDGDTFINVDEFTADTNPTNALSYLRFDGVSNAPAGPGLEFWSSSRRLYEVDESSSLLDGVWTPMGSSFFGEDDYSSITDTNALPLSIYRIRVWRP